MQPSISTSYLWDWEPYAMVTCCAARGWHTLELHAVGYAGLFNFEISGESRCPQTVRLLKLDYALALAQEMIGSAR